MPAAAPLSYSRFFRDELVRVQESFAVFRREREKWRKRAAIPVNTPWRRFWGGTYGPELKEWMLKPVFETLESEGKIGDIIVDVGSGAQPVTRLLESRPGRKRILVDVAGENFDSADEQGIRLDAEKVAQPEALSFRKALLRACKFLGTTPAAASPPAADTIVFSDLLNYVDFRKVLRGFSKYLRPDGRIVVVNLPMRGNESLFSEHGLKDNRHLYGFLEENQFEIEHKSFPCREPGETSEAEELIVLVARRCAAI
jgi:hypothetical protein